MKSRPELPGDVLEAVHSNRKIDAIKLLRSHRNLGLKDAKHMIDAYIVEHPQLIRQARTRGLVNSLYEIASRIASATQYPAACPSFLVSDAPI